MFISEYIVSVDESILFINKQIYQNIYYLHSKPGVNVN